MRATDPVTRQSVSFVLADGGAHNVEPVTAVLSMMRPDAVSAMLRPNPEIDEVAPAACGPINFFGTEESGRAFTERVEGTFLLAIDEGRELACHINRALFGSALRDDPR